MLRICKAVTCCGIALALWLGFASEADAGEGFGMIKKTTVLSRTNPPAVYIGGTRIAVRASGQSPASKDAAQRLQTLLESRLLGADKRFKLDPTHPETLVEVDVAQNEGNERWENRTELRRRQTGKDAKGKPVYTSYEVTVQYKIVTHRFGAAFKVRDARTGANLDADTATYRFEEAFSEGTNAPDRLTLEGNAVDRVVATIVPRLTPSVEAVGVLLPKGSLEDLANLADAKLWSKYLEALEVVPPKPKPADESYRQYAIGLAYEALSYGAEDIESTLKFLQQASSHYNTALETNPKEKFFSQPYDSLLTSKSASAPVERVQAALVKYQKLKEFRDAYEQAKLVPATATGGKAATAGGGDPRALDNAAVIEMVRAGLEEEIILTAIDSAPGVSFDTSPNGLIELAQAQVSKRIIQRIQTIAVKKASSKAKPKTSGKN